MIFYWNQLLILILKTMKKKNSLSALLQAGNGFSPIVEKLEFNLKGGASVTVFGVNDCNCNVYGNDCLCNGQYIPSKIPAGKFDNIYTDYVKKVVNNCDCFRTVAHPDPTPTVAPSTAASWIAWPEMF